MVNVTNCETIFVNGIVLLNNNKDSSYLAKIASIDNLYKPKCLQNKNEKEILEIANNLIKNIKEELNTNILHLVTDRNNRIGSDFTETITNTSIEIKLGKATDLNLGFQPVVVNLLDNKIEYFPTNINRLEWRNDYINNNIEKILDEQKTIFTSAVDYFTDNYRNKLLSDKQTNIVHHYYLGITNNDEINKDLDLRKIIRFDLQLDKTWLYIKREVIEQPLYYKNFIYTSNNRFSFIIGNNELNLTFIYNYKNNYKFANGIKVPAKIGLGSPSFNGKFTNLIPKTK